jgi:hypothetical protein
VDGVIAQWTFGVDLCSGKKNDEGHPAGGAKTCFLNLEEPHPAGQDNLPKISTKQGYD